MVEKNREITGVRGAPQYRDNPFMSGCAVAINGRKKRYTIASRTDQIIDPDGRPKASVEHSIVRELDDAQFVKVFADGIKGMYGLSSAGAKVFRFLFDQVQANPNTDRIYLYFMDAVEEPWSISKPQFYRGLAELLEKHFVARATNPNMFFLNPSMIWNGDRFRFVQEFRRKRDATSDQAWREQLEGRGQQRIALEVTS